MFMGSFRMTHIPCKETHLPVTNFYNCFTIQLVISRSEWSLFFQAQANLQALLIYYLLKFGINIMNK